MSQHAVKLDFLRRVHRRSAPSRRSSAHQHSRKTLKVRWRRPARQSPQLRAHAPHAPSLGSGSGRHQVPVPEPSPHAASRRGPAAGAGVQRRSRLPRLQAPHHGGRAGRGIERHALLGAAWPRVSPTSCPRVLQWLQDVLALQCSIMRHLSVRQSSSTPPADWASELKTGAKTCAPPGGVKPQDPSEWDSSPEPASKPHATPEGPRGAARSACQNCRKPNGPLAEERQPPKANGPVGCDSGPDSCRGAELQHRLKPDAVAAAAASELVNHIGAVDIKREPESGATEDCAQKNSPAAPTIWTHRAQNHQNQEASREAALPGDKDKLGSTSPSAGKIRRRGGGGGVVLAAPHLSVLLFRRQIRSRPGGPAAALRLRPVQVSEGGKVPGWRWVSAAGPRALTPPPPRRFMLTLRFSRSNRSGAAGRRHDQAPGLAEDPAALPSQGPRPSHLQQPHAGPEKPPRPPRQYGASSTLTPGLGRGGSEANALLHRSEGPGPGRLLPPDGQGSGCQHVLQDLVHRIW